MATRAERFKSAAERTGAAKPSDKKPRGGNRLSKTADTSKPGVGADARRWGGESTAARNRSKHAARSASYALEDSRAVTSDPSRKSTRASANRIKPDSPLKNRITKKTMTPTARATKAQASRKKAT
jgi:hypothetical protein